MSLALRKPMTLAELLEWEERQPLCYEFDGIGPVAMTGGTLAQPRIQRNLAFALTGRLRGKPCEFLGSDLKIKTSDDHVRLLSEDSVLDLPEIDVGLPLAELNLGFVFDAEQDV